MSTKPSEPASDQNVFDPAQWVDRHGDLLFRYALGRVRDRDAAEDLVQETLVAGLQARHRFEGRAQEATWLVGILRHKIADHFRKHARQLTSADTATPDDLFDPKGKWRHEPADWPAAPRSPAELAEFRRTLAACAEKLPPGLAEVYALSELEGLETRPVCDVLAISPTNLWTRLHRLRMMLRKCLEDRWLGRPVNEREVDS